MRALPSLWGLVQRVRVKAEPVLRAERGSIPTTPTRPALAATATRFEHIEQAVWARWRPQVCAAVTAALTDEAAAQRAAPRPLCCGRPMRRHDARAVSWLTWVGRVVVTVDRYRCRTCGRNTRPLLDLLEVEPGRPSGWLARRLALVGSVVPFTLAADLASPLLGVTANAMMVWRAVQRLGAAALAHTDALSAYHAAPGSVGLSTPAAPPAVVVAVDGCVVGVQPRTTRRRRPTKTTALPALRPVADGTFREVKTGVILAPTDRVPLPDRASLVRRVVVTGLADADALFRQVTAQLRERGWLTAQTVIVVVGDGSEWIWQRAALFAPRCEILDFWHAMEYAWVYARLQFGDGARRADAWTRRVATDLKAGQVQAVVRRLHHLQPRSPEATTARDTLVRYYTTHAHRMRYDEYLARGYGIGSGAVESAHKQVVHARLRQAGMRWSVRGAQHVLALRALLLNGQWTHTDHLRLARAA
ncbi:MAG TPA: ISKra4 family transposase [Burkholderiaceae bacterium]